MSQSEKRHHVSGGTKPGRGRAGDGKHFNGKASNANAHPKFGKGPVVGTVNLNQGMDPGTVVPHAAARRSSRNILHSKGMPAKRPLFGKR